MRHWHLESLRVLESLRDLRSLRISVLGTSKNLKWPDLLAVSPFCIEVKSVYSEAEPICC